MIETNYFILSPEQFQEFNTGAKEVGVSLDYFLLEFCEVTGDYVECD